MGAHSGKYGVVNGQEAVFNWSINDDATPAVVVDSSTDGATNRVSGINAWDGSFGQNLGQPSVLPGDTFTFTGFTAPDDGTPSGTGQVYSGSALCSQVAINWDWAGGANITSELTFLGHLALTLSTANHADAADSNPLSVCGTKIEYSSNGTVWTELPNISNATLTLSVATSDYVNSSTGCNTGRDSGPKDWTAAIVLDDTKRDASDIPAKGTQLWWRFYVDATTFWLCKWGTVRNFTGITVDRVSGAIVQQTMNVDMSVSDGTATGYVTAPDGTTDWQGTAP